MNHTHRQQRHVAIKTTHAQVYCPMISVRQITHYCINECSIHFEENVRITHIDNRQSYTTVPYTQGIVADDIYIHLFSRELTTAYTNAALTPILTV